MSLASRFSRYFAATIRQRGEDYFRKGRVQIEEARDGHATGTVRGGEIYEVDVDWDADDGSLRDAFCSCPYNDGGDLCKHIWAFVLAVDERISSNGRTATLKQTVRTSASSAWRRKLQLEVPVNSEIQKQPWPVYREICYMLDGQRDVMLPVSISLAVRDRKMNGEWSVFKEYRPHIARIDALPDAVDRDAIAMIAGAQPGYFATLYDHDLQLESHQAVSPALARILLPRLVQTGRLYFVERHTGAPTERLSDDLATAWSFTVTLASSPQGLRVEGKLARGDETLTLDKARSIYQGEFFVYQNRLARYDTHGGERLLASLRREGPIDIPEADAQEALSRIVELAPDAVSATSEALRFKRKQTTMRPLLRLSRVTRYAGDSSFAAELLFDYDNHRVASSERGRGILLADEHTLLLRDSAAEDTAHDRLASLDFKRDPYAFGAEAGRLTLHPSKLSKTVRTLVPEGWLIEADGQSFRAARATSVRVSSGIDWFEVHGEIDYGDATASLVDILNAIRAKENLVQLSDGGYGLLPEEWLARFAPLAATGELNGDHLRFKQSQTALLDVMLSAMPEARWDGVFAEARQKLVRFDGIQPAEQPAGFVGQLRDYQREGLAWLHFLRNFGFGGCLADDMGLGKTAQVLAYLEDRRAAGGGQSLVVVPRSLIFNWLREAERFTPRLRVMDYSGPQRKQLKTEGTDVMLCTYGTLRTDITRLQEIEFDTIVLDEAQTIKNASTAAAKASRLLKGQHRIALSGTPIENHLGELWSLFEFLNPGMLGSARAFAGFSAHSGDEDASGRAILASALRPFILRRTKRQVARELPERTEQTLYCALEGEQLSYYNKLRDAMRASVFGRMDSLGLAKARIHVLEALLRLRQAACHPALIDATRKKAGSAKLDLLLDQIVEVVDEGHKALVFSQFTSLLALVKERLDKRGIVYEYLDGQTRDRQARVDRFQGDEACPLFLISLKAGGLGLNLTAAEYVYLLDPWWNPAVEAQAIDRTHRIGQTRQVFAYRLVAKDTVEEKILELQARKRDLADAIITEDNSTLRNLTREDLEVLFS